MITEPEVPASVTSIGNDAFICTGLTSIRVDSNNPKYDSRDNCNALIETSSNTLIVGSKSTVIPNSVTSIGKSAFDSCSGLTSITIPNSVTSIGESAFSGCSSLTSITISNSVTSISEYAFDGTAWYDNQPDGMVYAGKVAYKYKGEMPANTQITLREGTLGITGEAFDSCEGLTSITIPNTVTSIGNWAFCGCSGLTSITIPNSVTSIGEGAYANCTSLSSITIPNSVIFIGDLAFDDTEWYDNQPDGLVYAGKVAYDYKGQMPANTHITLNEGTLGIAGSAFYRCWGLTSITIPNTVIAIGDWAFSECSDLTSITIPNSVITIGEGAFEDCTGLTSIIINKEVPMPVSSYTFSGDYNAILYVPAGCKSAYESADYWKDFKEIIEKEIEPTDISTLSDAIYANAATGLKGGDCTLTICLKNEQATSAYSFNLKLPKGVTLAKDGDDEYVYTLSNRHNGHSPSVNYNETTGVYSFAVLSLSSKEIKDNDGAIWTLKLNVAEDMEVGDYPVKIQNAKYSLTSGSAKVTMPEVTSILTIENYKKGDVNGDGDVDIADAVCIVNHVVGKETPIFIVAAADVNGDGDADIADAVRIVNLVVGKIPALAPRRDRRSMLEPE